MKPTQLCLLAMLCALGLAMLAPSVSCAAGYPDRNIQLIIPNVAGAKMDITARLLATELEKILGAKIIPNNKPGAGGVLGTDAALRSKKDGYTLLYGTVSAMVYAPVSNPEVVHYDPIKDAEPLGMHYFFPQTITVRADAPWKNFKEFVDYAKKNPGKIRVSTMGLGSQPHFVLEMLQSIAGIQLTHVPFEGGESVITAVLGGHVEATCDTLAKVKGQVEGGKMRMLLITNKMPGYSDVPTITELGYKQGLPGGWFAMYAPAGIPEDVKKVLVPAVEKAVKATKSKIDALGNLCEYRPPADVRKITEEEYKRALEIAKKMGLHK
ncbi:MAG TPA: tripartite tricarboxylate transporter substrate binding protein [Syntrophorhabdales bacterium]|nr:tripartite tricarboxylate transporter substrate binding protein [Syntrophorhabdales bacterium]